MQALIKFTAAAIERIVPPPAGRAEYQFDNGKAKYLRIRVTVKSKTWLLYKWGPNGKPIKVTLGKFPSLLPDTALKLAQQHLGELARGIDPNKAKVAKRRAAITLREVFRDYLGDRGVSKAAFASIEAYWAGEMPARELQQNLLEDYRNVPEHLKPSTVFDYAKELRNSALDWLGKPITQITSAMVEARYKQRVSASRGSGARAANFTRIVSALTNYARRYKQADGKTPLILESPVIELQQRKVIKSVGRRKTVLDRQTLPLWWQAIAAMEETGTTSERRFASYVRILLLTGCRSSEIRTLAWQDVSLQRRTITLFDTKNRTDITLPISDLVVAELRKLSNDSEFVFPAADGSKPIDDSWPRHRVEDSISKYGAPPYCLHDLRRSFQTIGEETEIAYLALKQLVNHKLPADDVTAGYVVMNSERLRAPLEKVTAGILARAGAIVESTSILPFPGAAIS
jgi:integrase